MAITIHQQPAVCTAIGSKTIFTATSSNSGNEGFSYKVELLLNGVVQAELFVPPNPNGALVVDPQNMIYPYVRNHVDQRNSEVYESIHGLIDQFLRETDLYLPSGFVSTGYRVYEAWIIDGVLTVDEGSMTGFGTTYLNAQLSLQQGLNYDYSNDVCFQDGLQSRIMSDRLPSTHFWPEAAANGLGGDYIYIPAYESDWGVVSTILAGNFTSTAEKVRVSLLPNSGPPVIEIVNIGNDVPGLCHFPLYPANLNASSAYTIKPQDYPNWKAVYFQFLNGLDEVVSQSYIMYNAARFNQCYNDQTKIRLAWVGRRGGWEYFNFCQNSFEEYVTEKKIAHRPIGNYGQVSNATPFAFNTYDETELITDMAVQKFVNASSDWVQDGEREFLKGLFLSKQVHWVQDDGSHIPVIVQSDGYQVKKVYGRGPLFKLDIKVKIAQEQFN